MNEEENITGNLDINQALKEFEEQSTGSPTGGGLIPNMDGVHSGELSGIKFETDTLKTSGSGQDANTSKMVGWIIKYSGGLISTKRIAEYTLLVVALLFFGLSIFFFLNGDTIFSGI